jgi:hypothetical protein
MIAPPKKSPPLMPENPVGLKGLADLLKYLIKLKAFNSEIALSQKTITCIICGLKNLPDT